MASTATDTKVTKSSANQFTVAGVQTLQSGEYGSAWINAGEKIEMQLRDFLVWNKLCMHRSFFLVAIQRWPSIKIEIGLIVSGGSLEICFICIAMIYNWHNIRPSLQFDSLPVSRALHYLNVGFKGHSTVCNYRCCTKIS